MATSRRGFETSFLTFVITLGRQRHLVRRLADHDRLPLLAINLYVSYEGYPVYFSRDYKRAADIMSGSDSEVTYRYTGLLSEDRFAAVTSGVWLGSARTGASRQY
jgi:hypothetical protein